MGTIDRSALLATAGFDLSPASAAELAARFRPRKLSPGSYLFHEGDRSGSLFVVADGVLEAVTTSSSGQELVFSMMGVASVIGELTIIDGSRRTASIRAVVASEVLGVSRKVFLEQARENPEIGLALASMCASRVRRLSEWATDVSFASLDARLASDLLTLASAAPSGVVHTTQQSLGDRLGVSRESVNKWLRTWERSGIVRLGRGSVSVVDAKNLRAIAQP